MVRDLAAVWLVCLCGCGLLLELDSERSAGSVDGSLDGSRGSHDASDDLDARDELDAAVVSPCGLDLEGDLVALYRFDDALAEESGAAPDGVGTPPFTFVSGAPGCGEAVSFPPRGSRDPGFIVLPAAEIWNLSEGSVDLMVRIDERTPAGILSRDAGGVAQGHFTLLMGHDGRLALRVQQMDGGENTICSSESLPLDTWVHIGIHIGPALRLFIDGRAQRYVGMLDTMIRGWVVTCSADVVDRPITGNDEPWLIGAGAWESEVGVVTPTAGALVGAVDHLRFWRTIVPFEERAP